LLTSQKANLNVNDDLKQMAIH